MHRRDSIAQLDAANSTMGAILSLNADELARIGRVRRGEKGDY